jgi:hypothetical protein
VTSITLCNNEQQERPVPRQQEDEEEDSSYDESVEKEPTDFILGEYVNLSTTDTPLAKLFGRESKVIKNHLNIILLSYSR